MQAYAFLSKDDKMKSIDPANVTNFHRSQEELQQFALFCLFVAGKQSATMTKKLDQFLRCVDEPFVFLNGLRNLGALRAHLEDCKIGQYNRLEKTIGKLLDEWCHNAFFLRYIEVEKLEKIMGMKSARFFILSTRPNQEVAVLDVHLLAHLRSLGYDAPKATPSSKKQYHKWEKVLLAEIEKSGKTPAEYDLDIWKERAK
jgi:thermostable 8-oxoguanine DNA glycosylase